jgi:hypothetical protein
MPTQWLGRRDRFPRGYGRLSSYIIYYSVPPSYGTVAEGPATPATFVWKMANLVPIQSRAIVIVTMQRMTILTGCLMDVERCNRRGIVGIQKTMEKGSAAYRQINWIHNNNNVVQRLYDGWDPMWYEDPGRPRASVRPGRVCRSCGDSIASLTFLAAAVLRCQFGVGTERYTIYLYILFY